MKLSGKGGGNIRFPAFPIFRKLFRRNRNIYFTIRAME